MAPRRNFISTRKGDIAELARLARLARIVLPMAARASSSAKLPADRRGRYPGGVRICGACAAGCARLDDGGREVSDDPINVSARNQYACRPRRCGLIDLEGEFTDNMHTARGSAEHERVDRVAHVTIVDGARIEYALPVWSGLLGRTEPERERCRRTPGIDLGWGVGVRCGRNRRG